MNKNLSYRIVRHLTLLAVLAVVFSGSAFAQPVSGNVNLKFKYVDPYTSTTKYVTNQNVTIQIPTTQSTLSVGAGYQVTSAVVSLKGVDTFKNGSKIKDKCPYTTRGLQCPTSIGTGYSTYNLGTGQTTFGVDEWVWNTIWQSFLVSSRTYTVTIVKFGVDISGPALFTAGQTKTWTASVSHAPGSVSYQWSYKPDGGSWTNVGGNSSSLTYTFNTPDSYTLKVVATSAGETTQDTYNIVVQSSGGCGGFGCRTAELSTQDLSIAQGVPESFSMEQNYPNPFNPSTEIQFALPAASHVSLFVYDMMGREVDHLVNRTLEAGYHRVTWDASGLPSGVYLYRIQAEAFTETRRMTLLK